MAQQGSGDLSFVCIITERILKKGKNQLSLDVIDVQAFSGKVGGKDNASWFSLACKKKKNSIKEHYKVMDGKREMKEWLKPEWKHMTCKSFHQHQTAQIVLLTECLIVPLRVARVGFWLQFKLVFYSSLSLQTVTGIKTLGKSAIDIRNKFHTEVKIWLFF